MIVKKLPNLCDPLTLLFSVLVTNARIDTNEPHIMQSDWSVYYRHGRIAFILYPIEKCDTNLYH